MFKSCPAAGLHLVLSSLARNVGSHYDDGSVASRVTTGASFDLEQRINYARFRSYGTLAFFNLSRSWLYDIFPVSHSNK